MPPPLAGAALAAIKILSGDKARRKKIVANTVWLRAQLQLAGWVIPETPGPIVRLPVLKTAVEARLKKSLLTAGIYPPFLKSGAAAHGTFRFVVSSEHTKSQMRQLADVLLAFALADGERIV